MTMHERITMDPSICHGKPCIRGLRYPVETVLQWLASGMSIEETCAITSIWSVRTFLRFWRTPPASRRSNGSNRWRHEISGRSPGCLVKF